MDIVKLIDKIPDEKKFELARKVKDKYLLRSKGCPFEEYIVEWIRTRGEKVEPLDNLEKERYEYGGMLRLSLPSKWWKVLEDKEHKHANLNDVCLWINLSDNIKNSEFTKLQDDLIQWCIDRFKALLTPLPENTWAFVYEIDFRNGKSSMKLTDGQRGEVEGIALDQFRIHITQAILMFFDKYGYPEGTETFHLSFDNLLSAIEYGKWTPMNDSCMGIYDYKGSAIICSI